jgi:pimeloyl-ACP methyl ester carboxylesterase
MSVICDAAHRGHTARTLLVMLPAAYTGPEDFVRAGFVSAVRERRLDIDLVFAGLELRHVGDRSLLARLRQEHIRAARARGADVWLGGISLGGYFALDYAERHRDEPSGLCLLAPYLGSHQVTAEIEKAGGVAQWKPAEVAEDDDERRIWSLIRTLRTSSLPVHLGLGRDDRFAGRHRLLAAALAPGSVDVVPGGHDWPTWRELWGRFLDARFGPHPPPLAGAAG